MTDLPLYMEVIKIGRKRTKTDTSKWWVKPPRSSRICYRCGHKYSSHIDVKCLKIVARKPERKECNCRGFIKDSQEMQLEYDKEKRRKERLEEE